MTKIASFFIFLFILSLSMSCEIDDICTQEVLTPKLIITFHDFSDKELRKEVDTLTVWAVDKDTLYLKKKTDSIAIPLNMNSDVVHYKLSSNNSIDSLRIHYERKEIFVSRSCGFKINFILLNNTQLTQNWTDDFEIKTQNVENEQNVHIQIYH